MNTDAQIVQKMGVSKMSIDFHVKNIIDKIVDLWQINDAKSMDQNTQAEIKIMCKFK